jgi:CubicO group peptidase (beta-lactamase class C family)
MAAKPKVPIRKALLYNNIMFSAAGEAIARAYGSTWEDLVARRIFKPLGMNATNTSVQEMQLAADHSAGYGHAAHEIRMRDLTNIAPAGAINSNARDMARWLRLMLKGGVFDGQRLVSESGFRELTARNIEAKQPNVYYGLHLRG